MTEENNTQSSSKGGVSDAESKPEKRDSGNKDKISLNFKNNHIAAFKDYQKLSEV